MAPALLLFFAACSAAVVAFGTRAELAQFTYGVELILLSRRLQWPLLMSSIVLCLAMVGLIVAGRRRAWWLIGLIPVLALFVHRFSVDPANDFLVLENPPFVPAGQVDFLADEDFVVGLVFEGKAYAYPYASLYAAPVIQQQDHDRRMLLMWSPFANRVQAWALTPALSRSTGRGSGDLRARDLEVVSMPANALLLYNSRRGEFINGLTGMRLDGEKPAGLGEPIQTHKMRWRQWREMHEETAVLWPVRSGVIADGIWDMGYGRWKMGGIGENAAGWNVLPAGPILPFYPVPVRGVSDGGHDDLADETRMTIIGTDPPLAVPSDSIDHRPLNLRAGGTPVLVFRDVATGQVRAFDRRLEEDLSPRFRLGPHPGPLPNPLPEYRERGRRAEVMFIDGDTNTGWSVEGVAVEGERSRRGRRLAPIVVDDDVYWGAVRFWYPGVQVHVPEGQSASE